MRALLVALLLLVSVRPLAAQEIDWDQLHSLTDTADAIEAMLRVSSPSERADLSRQAVDAYRDILEWYETTFDTSEFTGLAPEFQQTARAQADRVEYNLSRHLVVLDQCGEARERLRGLLARTLDDAEIRPLLTDAYDDSVECMARTRTAEFRVDVTPGDAELLVNGVFVGLATRAYPVPVGEHTITVRADGFVSRTLPLSANTEGALVALGPIVLEAVAPSAPTGSSEPVSIVVAPTLSTSVDVAGNPDGSQSVAVSSTGADGAASPVNVTTRPEPPRRAGGSRAAGGALIGVGLATLGGAAGFYADGYNREDQIENPPEGQVLADPDAEVAKAERSYNVSYALMGIGGAALVTGVVLMVKKPRANSSGSAALHFSPLPSQFVRLRVRF
jgi:hypothetical protein